MIRPVTWLVPIPAGLPLDSDLKRYRCGFGSVAGLVCYSGTSAWGFPDGGVSHGRPCSRLGVLSPGRSLRRLRWKED
jgi:hypothetical protein